MPIHIRYTHERYVYFVPCLPAGCWGWTGSDREDETRRMKMAAGRREKKKNKNRSVRAYRQDVKSSRVCKNRKCPASSRPIEMYM